MNNWYSICALDDGAEISIYDEIGAYGVSAKAFLADLGKLPDKVTVSIVGIAASAAKGGKGRSVTKWPNGGKFPAR